MSLPSRVFSYQISWCDVIYLSPSLLVSTSEPQTPLIGGCCLSFLSLTITFSNTLPFYFRATSSEMTLTVSSLQKLCSPCLAFPCIPQEVYQPHFSIPPWSFLLPPPPPTPSPCKQWQESPRCLHCYSSQLLCLFFHPGLDPKDNSEKSSWNLGGESRRKIALIL